MSTVCLSPDKSTLRATYRALRKEIPSFRREEASQALHQRLSETSGIVLSFSSLASELDLSLSNEYLAREGRLCLPRIEGRLLGLYRVSDLSLVPGPWGLLEPDPTQSERIPLEDIDLILVPGLAFDSDGYRLGYGGGYYDRLLTAEFVTSWGIGFREQLSSSPLPRDPHDQPVSQVILA